jgi:7-cyano-7-deazaguanine synthase
VCFNYGQKHVREVGAAVGVASYAGLPSTHFKLINIGPILAGRSPLTNPAAQLETYVGFEQMDKTIGDRVELTFVPMRNALFLTLAINQAVALDIYEVYTGVCQADNANYPDCTEPFIYKMEMMANEALGLSASRPGPVVRINTPLMNMSKAESIKLAIGLVNGRAYEALAWSHTAYSGEYPPITQDHATVLRAHGFEEAGVPDPLIVRAYVEGLIEKLPTTANYSRFADSLETLKREPVIMAIQALGMLVTNMVKA